MHWQPINLCGYILLIGLLCPAELGAAIRLEADLWLAAGYKRLAVLQSRVA
jgi:hypothetical protein